MPKDQMFKIGTGIVVILLGAIFLFISPKPSTAPSLYPEQNIATSSASTSVQTSTSTPKSADIKVTQTITFDPQSLTTTSNYPIISGTSNEKSIDVVIFDKGGVALVGASAVEVTKGHWSYSPPTFFASGTYYVLVVAGGAKATAPLVVK